MNEKIGNISVGVSCLELGGFNGLIPVLAAYKMGLPLFDVNVMCRAFPEVKNFRL